MAEYIERTEELMLAMNAGARAIENTKRYHGAVYTKNVFSESPQEIPYLQAAKVLREVSDAPAADVAPVVHGRWIEREEKPICRSCKFMRVTSYAKTTGNNRHLKGSRGNCMCKHPNAVKTFNKVCPRSPRMAAFIGYTSPGETKPALKTSPT